MTRIYVDNRPLDVDGSQNLLHACLTKGLNLPYFCWHPALGSVGACRQCAVKEFKDEKDERGKIVMACMTEAHDGLRISIDDSEAKEFRKAIIEWLMMNHPHDCPVCDEGGECHLQDMTVMNGHDYRRYHFKKRTYRNQDLGPLVNHEMNRCIQCYRCVRFYRDYAGGRDLDVFGCHDELYFGRESDGVLESEFSGNLVEVCPTGVFTDKTLKHHYVRKWDLQGAPSVCAHCSLGCSTIPQERGGSLRRVVNRYNFDVNGYFLCDRGRYAYEFENSPRRIRRSVRRNDGKTEFLDRERVIAEVAEVLSKEERIIGIGSPRASLEANFLLRQIVGPDRFSVGIPASLAESISACYELMRSGPARSPSLREISEADAILVLGEDLLNTAPMTALSIRQSVLVEPTPIAEKLKIPRWHDQAFRTAIGEQRGPLFLAVTHKTGLDDIARHAHRLPPQEIARLGFAVARLVRGGGLGEDFSEETVSQAKEIAEALGKAKRPIVISGTHAGMKSIAEAAAAVAWALRDANLPAQLSFVLPECNSLGLGMLGGMPLDSVRGAETIVVLENDLSRFGELGRSILKSTRRIIVLDHTTNPTSDRASFVLASATASESDGTFINNEGRAQRFIRVFETERDIKPSWRWFAELLSALGREEIRDVSDVTARIAESDPIFGPLKDLIPVKPAPIAGEKIPRQPHRHSGRTAMHANLSVHEPKPPEDRDSPLSFSMEGDPLPPPGPLIPFFWSPGWNSVQSTARYQKEVGGELLGGDPGRRLIEPKVERPQIREVLPEAFGPRAGSFLLFPIYRLFGSGEMSRLAPAIQERIPHDFVALSEKDASKLDVGEGDKVSVSTGGKSFLFDATLKLDVPEGTVGCFTSSREHAAFHELSDCQVRRFEVSPPVPIRERPARSRPNEPTKEAER